MNEGFNPHLELPKGMEIEIPEAPEIKPPALVNLRRGNYVAAIYQALEILPVEVRVEECTVFERAGQPPEVRLTLHVIREKEEVNNEAVHD